MSYLDLTLLTYPRQVLQVSLYKNYMYSINIIEE